ncbi:MAG: hypothetical protein DHS80DRAFT_29861 [Piptocephalis tieghemiana]|nr:MAG: hypothetical protein DHS80DRAFT_29861 [Piptocephalis tieghemiana]
MGDYASGNIVTELKPGSILFSLGLGGLATNVVVGDAMGFAIAHLEMERGDRPWLWGLRLLHSDWNEEDG